MCVTNQMNAQKYCFLRKKHSQIVQIYSQIVQIFLFSSQIAIFRYIKNPCHAGDRDDERDYSNNSRKSDFRKVSTGIPSSPTNTERKGWKFSYEVLQ